MPITINGTGTITGISAGGLPDAIITQPELAANVAGNGPAFSAYQSSGQVIGASVATKIQFQTEVFDTATAFDSTTNYRFTPLVAGYYQATGAIYFGAAAQGTQLYIYKNGSNYLNNAYIVANGSTMTGLVYLNGSTDYLELWCFLVSGSTLSGTSQNTYFQATMVRSA
jgi:hypothetical protein